MDEEFFTSEEEANAFVKGMQTAQEAIDDDHLWVHEPVRVSSALFRVDYGINC